MSNRPATVTQADVQRVIRACRKEGVAIARVVVRGDGVSIETTEGEEVAVHRPTKTVAGKRELVL